MCGELCADLTISPIDLKSPLAGHTLSRVGPIVPSGGGLVANSGLALAKMGFRAAAMARVGSDNWADLLIALLESGGVSTFLHRVAGASTSVTAVLVGEEGAHFFAHHSGASKLLTAEQILGQLDVFAHSRFALFGYYGLGSELESQLPAILPRIRETGCQVALDSAGGGGGWSPLGEILPYLDVYIPSHDEARAQTGRSDPREMIAAFRERSPQALLGVKLGDAGALLSPGPEQWLRLPPATPPGPVCDTTGAGDCFYAGLLGGLARGLSLSDAGRLAAAAGACSVTGMGAVAGLPTGDGVWRLANVERPDGRPDAG